jgi:hypothetical protein
MDLYDKLEKLVADYKDDYQKAKGGNKAAGTRVRGGMQEIKATVQEIREFILDSRKGEDDAPAKK